MKRFLFVGEKPSKTAHDKGWKWEDGRLAAKQLFDCMRMVGQEPEQHRYVNLWTYEGQDIELVVEKGEIVVAMGAIVSRKLNRLGVEHRKIIHPAARGKIRKKCCYANHLRERLDIGWRLSL